MHGCVATAFQATLLPVRRLHRCLPSPEINASKWGVDHGNSETAGSGSSQHQEGPGGVEGNVACGTRPGPAPGRSRKKPGAGGEGEFFRIVVRPKEEFVTFRTQDVGEPGHIERLAGKRQSGSWDTQAWLISKQDAHVKDDRLIPDTAEARNLLARLGSEPRHVKGDVFKAKDRPNIPEREKPTAAQQRARMANIKKAQAARHGE